MYRLKPSLPHAALVGLGLLVPPALLALPVAAQSAEDWGTAPLAIPGAPAAAPAPPSPPPRQVLQAPAELRRPQAPLLPGQPNRPAPEPTGAPPDVRIAPGPGVRPQLPPRPAAPAAPVRVPVVVVVPRSVPTPAPPPPQAPASRPSPREAFPSILESLPPGTIRPLPGEVLPGSRPNPTLQGLPPPPAPPQAVPPPPWADRQAQRAGQEVPWAWLLLGLGVGGAAMSLVQQGRRLPTPVQVPLVAPLESLGIRIEPRPDPGVQTLLPAAAPGEAPRPSGGE
jgi:hypothetical protein